jgi:hypothetical protein
MDVEPTKTFRPWLAWLIGCVWAGTAVAVFTASHIHPATVANISLNTKRISFRTNASHVLNASNEEQLIISGIRSLRIAFTTPQRITIGGILETATLLEIEGGPSASCSFYQIRTSPIELPAPAIITLDKINPADNKSFSLQTHGALGVNISSQFPERNMKPGFDCSGVHEQGAPSTDIEGTFSSSGGDTVVVASSDDARLDYVLSSQSDVGDTQIPILEGIRFSEIDTRTGDEKSVLIKPPAQVTFERLDKKVALDDAELLVVVPQRNFYLKQFTVTNGIQLGLHGVVKEVKAGAGANDLSTLMPSAFEHLDNAKRIYGVVPALVALIIGILEKMGALGKK